MNIRCIIKDNCAQSTDTERLVNNKGSRGDTWISLKRETRIGLLLDCWGQVGMGIGESRIKMVGCSENEERLQELGNIWELVCYLVH